MSWCRLVGGFISIWFKLIKYMTQEREIDSGEGDRVGTHTFGLGREGGGEEIAIAAVT